MTIYGQGVCFWSGKLEVARADFFEAQTTHGSEPLAEVGTGTILLIVNSLITKLTFSLTS